MKPIDATNKKNRRDWTFTWYQKYYRLLADWKVKKLCKYDKRGRYQGHGLEYHHVKPVSIYGVANNLIVVVPGNVHARLHWLLWKHYEEKSMDREASKMKYAYETLNEKYGTTDFYEVYWNEWPTIEKDYKHLVKHYSI